jgi:hypothetical protein
LKVGDFLLGNVADQAPSEFSNELGYEMLVGSDRGWCQRRPTGEPFAGRDTEQGHAFALGDAVDC